MAKRQNETAPTLKEAIENLGAFSRAERLELRSAVDAMLDAIAPASDDGKLKGHIEWKLIPDKTTGKTYGPYPYLRYRHDGRLKSQYQKHLRESPSRHLGNGKGVDVP